MKDLECSVQSDSSPGKVPSSTISYKFKVAVKSQEKKLNLTLGYNTFEERNELDSVEKEYFSKEFIDSARSGYWPTPEKNKKENHYPKFARDDQFNAADIILSHRCGDWNLLQLDYLRAILKAKEKKQRVVLTEHPQDTYILERDLPGYKTNSHTLKNNYYGYSIGEPNQKVGAIKISL